MAVFFDFDAHKTRALVCLQGYHTVSNVIPGLADTFLNLFFPINLFGENFVGKNGLERVSNYL